MNEVSIKDVFQEFQSIAPYTTIYQNEQARVIRINRHFGKQIKICGKVKDVWHGIELYSSNIHKAYVRNKEDRGNTEYDVTLKYKIYTGKLKTFDLMNVNQGNYLDVEGIITKVDGGLYHLTIEIDATQIYTVYSDWITYETIGLKQYSDPYEFEHKEQEEALNKARIIGFIVGIILLIIVLLMIV